MDVQQKEFDLQSASADEVLNEFGLYLHKALPSGRFIMAALYQATLAMMLRKGIVSFDEMAEAVATIDSGMQQTIKQQQQAIITPAAGASIDPQLLNKLKQQVSIGVDNRKRGR